MRSGKERVSGMRRWCVVVVGVGGWGVGVVCVALGSWGRGWGGGGRYSIERILRGAPMAAVDRQGRQATTA